MAIVTTGRVIRLIRRSLTANVPESYPTIEDPSSGSEVPGNVQFLVVVTTNRPAIAHEVRVITTDGLATVLSTVPVVFAGNLNPGKAFVTLPAAGAVDTDYFIEVAPVPTGNGPPHRIVVTVLAAGAPLAAGIDYGGNPPGTYPPPLDLHLTGVGSGGTMPYAINWTTGGSPISADESLKIQLSSSGSTYTFTCHVSDGAGGTDQLDAVYTIR